MPLSCAEEVYRYIGGAFESAFQDPRLGPRLSKSRLRLRFGVVDPDCVMHIDTEHQRVQTGRVEGAESSTMVAMNADTANRCCQGRLDVTSAMERGDVAAEGDIKELLDLVSTGSDFTQLYLETLRREGRADLIVS